MSFVVSVLLSFNETSVSRPCYIRQTCGAKDLQPRTALIVLTALNLLNYADRNVLFAVQPLVQQEFHLTNAQIGYLTSAFLGFYMIAAPFVAPLADRYSRKLIIVLGAIFWSGLTLLTAVTHNYTELLIRHTLVGVGEATFVTIAPTFVADLFPRKSARTNSRHVLSRNSGRLRGWISARRLPRSALWLAFPVLYCSRAGISARDWRHRFSPSRSAANSTRIRTRRLPEGRQQSSEFLVRNYYYLRKVGFNVILNPAFLTATLGMAS